MIQHIDVIPQGHRRCFESGNGSRNAPRSHIARWIVFQIEQEEPRMTATGGEDQIMQVDEVLIMPRQEGCSTVDGLGEVLRI